MDRWSRGGMLKSGEIGTILKVHIHILIYMSCYIYSRGRYGRVVWL